MYGKIILQSIHDSQRDFPRIFQHCWNVESYKEEFECMFQIRKNNKMRHDVRLTVTL